MWWCGSQLGSGHWEDDGPVLDFDPVQRADLHLAQTEILRDLQQKQNPEEDLMAICEDGPAQCQELKFDTLQQAAEGAVIHALKDRLRQTAANLDGFKPGAVFDSGAACMELNHTIDQITRVLTFFPPQQSQRATPEELHLAAQLREIEQGLQAAVQFAEPVFRQFKEEVERHMIAAAERVREQEAARAAAAKAAYLREQEAAARQPAYAHVDSAPGSSPLTNTQAGPAKVEVKNEPVCADLLFLRRFLLNSGADEQATLRVESLLDDLCPGWPARVAQEARDGK